MKPKFAIIRKIQIKDKKTGAIGVIFLKKGKKSFTLEEIIARFNSNEIAEWLCDNYNRSIRTKRTGDRSRVHQGDVDSAKINAGRKNLNYLFFQCSELLLKKKRKNDIERIRKYLRTEIADELLFADVDSFCKHYGIVIFETIKEAAKKFNDMHKKENHLTYVTVAKLFLQNHVIRHELNYSPHWLVDISRKLIR